VSYRALYGVTSLILAAIGVAIAAVIAFAVSWGWGVAYLAICVAAPPIVLYAYCAKCPSRACCAHVLPGKLAAAVFKGRPAGPYTVVELAAVGGALSLLFGLPVAWLWRFPAWLAVFVGLNVTAVIEIRAVVCRRCENAYCSLRPELT